jgi:hypothetical protein
MRLFRKSFVSLLACALALCLMTSHASAAKGGKSADHRKDAARAQKGCKSADHRKDADHGHKGKGKGNVNNGGKSAGHRQDAAHGHKGGGKKGGAAK